MGSKAIIGAVAAVIIGVSTYYIYGKKNLNHGHDASTASEKEGNTMINIQNISINDSVVTETVISQSNDEE